MMPDLGVWLPLTVGGGPVSCHEAGYHEDAPALAEVAVEIQDETGRLAGGE